MCGLQRAEICADVAGDHSVAFVHVCERQSRYNS